MRTATYPAVRTAPHKRDLVQSMLLEGETLSSFIDETLFERALARQEDQAFYARAIAASKRIDAGGPTISAEESYALLKAIADRAKQGLAKKQKTAA